MKPIKVKPMVKNSKPRKQKKQFQIYLWIVYSQAMLIMKNTC